MEEEESNRKEVHKELLVNVRMKGIETFLF